MLHLCKIYLIIVGFFICACSNGENNGHLESLIISEDTVSCSILGKRAGNTFIIKKEIDLNSKRCFLPDGISLKFEGGVIKNGALVGQMTKLSGRGVFFDRVRIEGTWDVPFIKSSFFKNLNYGNSLRDVVALSHPAIKNKIVVDEGVYFVTASNYADVCVPICCNTEFILNGTIRLLPNEFGKYFIIHAEGNNIIIKGKGQIIGDKNSHTGANGEWGMGINLKDAHHVKISGLTIKDCWGDCIYVGGRTTNAIIEKCNLDNGRRQGISITSARNVKISNCSISNVGGTDPEYAIDLEPNKNDTVEHVVINNVKVSKCKGGILVYGRAQDTEIRNVTIRKSKTRFLEKNAISIIKCDSIEVNDCELLDCKIGKTVYCEDVDNLMLHHNSYSVESSLSNRLMSKGKQLMDNCASEGFIIRNCKDSKVWNNKEVTN